MTNNFDEKLRKHIAELDTHKMPDRDLWKGIAQSLETNTQQRLPLRYSSVAASIAFLVISVWFVSKPIHESSIKQQNLMHLANFESAHHSQMDMLYSDYQGQTALSGNWQNQINELEEMAQMILEELKKDPDNLTLIKMLKNIYQQKVSLVERVHKPKWDHIYSTPPEVAL